jgi:DNA modification methylase
MTKKNQKRKTSNANNNNYMIKILRTSKKYLQEIFTEKELEAFMDDWELELKKPLSDKIPKNVTLTHYLSKESSKKKNIRFVIDTFSKIYAKHIKEKYQHEENPNFNKKLNAFINKDSDKVKILWGNCLDYLKQLPAESIQLMVTSPPYYNAREYTQWKDLTAYLDDMRKIIKECYRVLDNHRVFLFNVGDIFDNDNLVVRSVWGKRRLPLGAYFIKIFEECGFTFVDDFIWDKGEVQSQRHKNGQTPYPLYQYPMNCYEHILIFHKHRLDKTRYPCPVCGSLKVSGNTQSERGIQSWECKNNDCFERSENNRGKRFSLKTNLVQNDILRSQNIIPHELVKKWRRDIIKFSPVIKINSKGENKLGHTAPFPEDIPEMAVRFFTYEGDIVLDPFAGSFTSCIVANRLNRIGLGIELRKDLFEKSIKKNIHNHKMNFEEF